jgi:hypothetical protein
MTIHLWCKRYNWKQARENYLKNWMGEVAKNKMKRDQMNLALGHI